MSSDYNTAIAVVNIGKDNIFKYCLHSLEYFCDKYKCGLEIIESSKYKIEGFDGYNYAILEKNQIFDLFDRYDRILRVDTDVLINPFCPNVFDIVPREKIGAVFEDVGSRENNRRRHIQEAQKILGMIDWDSGYFNSGVIIVSKEHRDLFKLTDKVIQTIVHEMSGAKEQTLLNYRVRKYGYEVHELDFRFNHTRIFSEPWNGSPSRLDSFIIHYAGHQKSKQRLIKKDFKQLFKGKL